MNFLQNIKFRLTLWYLLILVILIFLFSGITYFMLAMNVYHVSHPPSDTVTSFVVGIEPPALSGENATSSSPDNAEYRPLLNYNITKEQVAGIVLEPDSFLQIAVPEGTISLDQKIYITPAISGEQEVSLYYRPVTTVPDSYEILAVTKSRTEVKYTLMAFQQTLIFAIPITLILAGCLSFFLMRKALKPVDVITKTAREIEEKDLKRRIPVRTKDELGRLSETLNQMFDRLQKAFYRERQFTADASHEMRTPLSVIQAEASLALTKERSGDEYRKSLELISHKTSYMTSIIRKLLELARVDNDRESLNFEDINLKDIFYELEADTRILCEEKQIRFELNMQNDLIVKGEKIKLKELFLNLLDNAIRYTLRGGNIQVTLSKQGNDALVTVSDTGIGIPDEHLPHIFERFYRVDKSHECESGAGLGLSICRKIVELHGGKIEVKSKVGEGSTFSVSLPIIQKS